jgi:DNA-binding transcriptional LysR family regulator
VDRFYQITVFVAVVDTCGFAGAARKLGISPPAVTRAIADLEEQLQVRLLTRTTRVVRVTEAGARYAQDCRRILLEMTEADESLLGNHGEIRGNITLTAPVLFGAKFVAPVVADYLGQHASLNASCLFVDRVVNLIEEGIDIGIRIGHLNDSTLRAIQVGTVARVVCASPAYLGVRGVPKAPTDLAAHCVVSANALDSAPEWRFTKNGQPISVKLAPRIITVTNDSAIAMVINGFGITRLLSYQVADHLRDGSLIELFSEFQSERLPVHIVHREGRHASSKVRVLIDLMIARFRSDPLLNSFKVCA